MKDDATPAQVAAHVKRIIRRHKVHVVTGTEAQRGDSRAVAAAVPGYGSRRAGGRIVTWRKERLRIVFSGYFRLTEVYDDPEGWRDMHVGVFVLEDLANGLHHCFIVPHAAATVQHGTGWNPRNVKGRQSHEQGWPKVRELADAAESGELAEWVRGRPETYDARPLDKMGRALAYVNTDANLDQKVRKWRVWLSGQLGRPSVWSGRVPKLGSHGAKFGRLIDTCHTTVRVVRAFVSRMKKRWPMDHGVIVMVFDLTAELRKR